MWFRVEWFMVVGFGNMSKQLRQGGPGMKSSAEYPRGFAKKIFTLHQRDLWDWFSLGSTLGHPFLNVLYKPTDSQECVSPNTLQLWLSLAPHPRISMVAPTALPRSLCLSGEVSSSRRGGCMILWGNNVMSIANCLPMSCSKKQEIWDSLLGSGIVWTASICSDYSGKTTTKQSWLWTYCMGCLGVCHILYETAWAKAVKDYTTKI